MFFSLFSLLVGHLSDTVTVSSSDELAALFARLGADSSYATTTTPPPVVNIRLAAGVYELHVPLTVKASVNITGAGAAVTIVKCSRVEGRAFDVAASARSFALRGVTVVGCATGAVWVGRDAVRRRTQLQTLNYTLPNAPAPTPWHQLSDVYYAVDNTANNTANGGGSVVVTDAVFRGNALSSSELLAAVVVGSRVSDLHVEGCLFQGNGRALLSTGAASVTVLDSAFRENGAAAAAAAVRGGGALAAGGALALLGGTASVNITDCAFERNTVRLPDAAAATLGSTARGGAVAIELPSAATVALVGCAFAGNSASPTSASLGGDDQDGFASAMGARGGAVAATVGPATVVSVVNCTFDGNAAVGAWGSGGALSVVSHAVASVSIRDSVFDGNAAGMSGGAVAVTTSGDVEVSRRFRANYLVTTVA